MVRGTAMQLGMIQGNEMITKSVCSFEKVLRGKLDGFLNVSN